MNRPIFKEIEDHQTYRNIKGDVVPSVTTIIKMINKEELLYWSNSLGFKRKSVKQELEISAYIGSTVHDMIEKFTTTGIYDIDKIDRKGPAERILIKNAFMSFLKFYTKNRQKLEIISTEKQMSGKRFGGTLDLLTKYDGLLTLADYKTSKDFYPTMILQLAGYDILQRELFNIKVDQYMIILLDKKDGREARIKIIKDKEEMANYRKCFKKLVMFYYDWLSIEQKYWDK